MSELAWQGYLRKDGRKGIRNLLLVIYTVQCAEFVASRPFRVNAIAPGWIETPMLEAALAGDPERRQKILLRTPQQRFGKPEDIGWCAAFLSSTAASFIDGAVLPVDGGASIGF